jgi:hypothetical protein
MEHENTLTALIIGIVIFCLMLGAVSMLAIDFTETIHTIDSPDIFAGHRGL